MRLSKERPAGGSGLVVSATGVGKWRGCQRAWGWEVLWGRKRPTSRWQRRGIDVHAVLARYLGTGRWEGPAEEVGIAQAGAGLLPAPNGTGALDHLLVEQKFYLEADGVVFVGVIDCLDMVEGLVIDHKTTSALRWVPTADKLRGDVQVLIYSAMAQAFPLMAPKLRWIYYLTRGRPQAQPVEFGVQELDFHVQWGRLMQDVAAMQNAYVTRPRPAEMVGNWATCADWGGCPYRAICISSPDEAAVS